MFDTPQEAALKAELARLRAENDWLRRAVESPSIRITEYGAEDSLIMSTEMYRELRLPRAAGVQGKLMDDGRWSVIVTQDRIQPDQTLTVSYFTDGYRRRHIDDMTFVNHVLPKMHEQFIRSLSDIFVKAAKR